MPKKRHAVHSAPTVGPAGEPAAETAAEPEVEATAQWQDTQRLLRGRVLQLQKQLVTEQHETVRAARVCLHGIATRMAPSVRHVFQQTGSADAQEVRTAIESAVSTAPSVVVDLYMNLFTLVMGFTSQLPHLQIAPGSNGVQVVVWSEETQSTQL